MQNSPLTDKFDLFDTSIDWKAVYGKDGCNNEFYTFVQFVKNRYGIKEENAYYFCVSWCTSFKLRRAILFSLRLIIELFTFDYSDDREPNNNKEGN